MSLARGTAFLLSALVALDVAAAQNPTTPGGTSPGPRVVQAPPQLLQLYHTTAATLQDLTVPTPTAQFGIELVLAGQLSHLSLHPQDVRAPTFQLLVADAAGVHQVPVPPSVTYRGELVGDPDSAVAMTIVNGQLEGIVRTASAMWNVQPVRAVDPTAPLQQHIVFAASDLVNLPFHCGVATTPWVPGHGQNTTDVVYIAQIACEGDFPLYQLLGSNSTSVQNSITGVVNGMDVIYRRDCQIGYTISTILVRTAADPYSSTDPGTLLNQFTNWWNANQGGVARDTAHLFTGRVINGNVIGVAFLGVVCNLPSAYGLDETYYAGLGTAMSFRVGLTSHEVGHNWNAQHCDGSPDCRIMCSGLGGCSGNVTSFSPGEAAQIIAYRNSVGCLTVQLSVPSITGVTPGTVTTFHPPQVTITGIGMTGVNQVQVGSTVVTSGIVVTGDTTVRFTPPEGLLGITVIRAVNSAGTSNPFGFFYTVTQPIQLVVPAAVLGGSNMVWNFGGLPNHIYFLGVSLTNTTSLFNGWPWLNNNTILSIGLLDAVGISSYLMPIPPAVLNGLQAYSQVLGVDPANLTLDSSSNIGSTRVFF
ncbi:MAG TPA: M12 family metallo-peptidase [Planctomycetota bacterium]|nr:M12 family metallo-peptidase [Planctomycetota bacterium]